MPSGRSGSAVNMPEGTSGCLKAGPDHPDGPDAGPAVGWLVWHLVTMSHWTVRDSHAILDCQHNIGLGYPERCLLWRPSSAPAEILCLGSARIYLRFTHQCAFVPSCTVWGHCGNFHCAVSPQCATQHKRITCRCVAVLTYLLEIGIKSQLRVWDEMLRDYTIIPKPYIKNIQIQSCRRKR